MLGLERFPSHSGPSYPWLARRDVNRHCCSRSCARLLTERYPQTGGEQGWGVCDGLPLRSLSHIPRGWMDLRRAEGLMMAFQRVSHDHQVLLYRIHWP